MSIDSPLRADHVALSMLVDLRVITLDSEDTGLIIQSDCQLLGL